MDVVHAGGMAAERGRDVAAGEGEVAGVEEEAHRNVGRGHEQVDLGLGLDHRAHVVMVGERAALLLQPVGEPGELLAVAADVVGAELRAVGDRHRDPVLHRVRGLGIDQHRAAECQEEIELLAQASLLLVQTELQQAAREPAGDEGQAMVLEQRPQHLGIERELAALLHAGITGGAGFAQAALERDVAAELGQVVVGPADGGDAEADGHAGRSLPDSSAICAIGVKR